MNKTPFDKICIEAVAFVISDRVDIIERYRRSFPHRPLKTSLSGILWWLDFGASSGSYYIFYQEPSVYMCRESSAAVLLGLVSNNISTPFLWPGLYIACIALYLDVRPIQSCFDSSVWTYTLLIRYNLHDSLQIYSFAGTRPHSSHKTFKDRGTNLFHCSDWWGHSQSYSGFSLDTRGVLCCLWTRDLWLGLSQIYTFCPSRAALDIPQALMSRLMSLPFLRMTKILWSFLTCVTGFIYRTCNTQIFS